MPINIRALWYRYVPLPVRRRVETWWKVALVAACALFWCVLGWLIAKWPEGQWPKRKVK